MSKKPVVTHDFNYRKGTKGKVDLKVQFIKHPDGLEVLGIGWFQMDADYGHAAFAPLPVTEDTEEEMLGILLDKAPEEYHEDLRYQFDGAFRYLEKKHAAQIGLA